MHTRSVLLALLLALCGGWTMTGQSQDPDYAIVLANRRFTPQPGIAAALRDALAQSGPSPIYGIAQLSRPVDGADRVALARAGVTLDQYLGGTAYLAAFAPAADPGRFGPLVRWAGLLLAEDKLAPDVCNDRFQDWARTAGGDVKVLVDFHESVDSATATSILAKHAHRFKRHGPNEVWAVEIDPAQVRALAAENLVRWIEQGPHPMMPLSPG